MNYKMSITETQAVSAVVDFFRDPDLPSRFDEIPSELVLDDAQAEAYNKADQLAGSYDAPQDFESAVESLCLDAIEEAEKAFS